MGITRETEGCLDLPQKLKTLICPVVTSEGRNHCEWPSETTVVNHLSSVNEKVFLVLFASVIYLQMVDLFGKYSVGLRSVHRCFKWNF